ncbi:peptidase M28 [Thalassotalea insulae]|uniref:Carboxypeptidase Q n=1 Tax=Thalassotalea insulae TaxID=2056778 RepID=A0ABQ6GTW2_9GAMM|nr:M20/M25/M40 family metallo-hydrolase [Thalassotalea insulae]GLX77890.1 peptidase M28 [Thalassotalea insulae]
MKLIPTAHNKTLMNLLCSCVLFSAVAGANALSEQQQAQMEQLKATSLNSDLSYQLIESLTTEVGPRLMGSEGDKKAVQWAVNKMKALGFDKVWTEEVTGTLWHRGQAEAQIIAPYPQKLVAIALGGSVGTGEQGITAEIAHFASLDELKAAPDNSLAGKIAFISKRMDRHIDGHGYGETVGARVNGASIAAQKGASAIIIRSIGTDNNRIAHTGVMRYQDGIAKVPAAAVSNPDADMLVNQLKREQAVKLYLKLTPSTDEKVKARSANVIGEITGSEFPEQIVAIGAHLDSWDVGTGALDDGMGVGIVMAAAHHIKALANRPKRTVRVILFAAEEVGLLGAQQYMIDHKDEIANHVIGAEWDFGTGGIYQMTTGMGPQALSATEELGKVLAPLGVKFIKENNAKAQSDMGMLSAAGMPSVNFAPDGSRYFDYHHTENDTLDKIEPEGLKQATAVYTLFSYFAANSAIDFSK